MINWNKNIEMLKNFFVISGRMAHLLNQSAAGSSDNDSQSESLTPRSQVPGHSPRHSPHHYFFSQVRSIIATHI